jgi:hypothetical protein
VTKTWEFAYTYIHKYFRETPFQINALLMEEELTKPERYNGEYVYTSIIKSVSENERLRERERERERESEREVFCKSYNRKPVQS